MNVEGRLRVKLSSRSGVVEAVDVERQGRGLPSALMRGRPAAEVVQLMPRLFSICGLAQGAAAAAAVAAAQRQPASIGRDRQIAVMTEALQETLWRLLIDWPQTLDIAPRPGPVRTLRGAVASENARVISAAAESIAAAELFGEPSAAWRQRTLADVDRWIATADTLAAELLRVVQSEGLQLGRADTALMPVATEAALQTAVVPYLQRPDYDAAPLWDGRPVETGALARQAMHPLLAAWLARDGSTAAARLLARLLEFTVLIDQIRLGDDALAAVRQHAAGHSTGIGVAETARGLLLHQATVDDGRVTDYRIVAPTEWNCHPAGPIASLRGQPSEPVERLQRRARIVLRALDPCVASEIDVVEMDDVIEVAGAANA